LDVLPHNYLANSPLLSQIVFKQNVKTRMAITESYDYLNRLTQISSAPTKGGVLPLNSNYSYNAANQRTKNILADGRYWIYSYDLLGQVINAVKHFSDGTFGCVCGSDLSGSMQGAGGVGGLLEMSYYSGSVLRTFLAS
jgi:YD repeat-containing protein